MTTVIIDKQDKRVYSDTRASWTKVESKLLGLYKVRSLEKDDKFHKVWRKQHSVFACAGSVMEIEDFIAKFGTSKQFTPKNSCIYAINVTTNKILKHGIGCSFESNRYIVFGSGGSTAWGRLHANYNPVDAIKAAHLQDAYTSNNVRVIDYSDDCVY